MAVWRVEFTPIAERDLRRLDKHMRLQVTDRIERLAEHIETLAPVPLHADFKGLFKLLGGVWRVAYTFEPSMLLIKIRMIDHRSKIYKRRV